MAELFVSNRQGFINKELRRKVSELEMRGASAVPSVDESCQTESSEVPEAEGNDRYKRLYKEKCAIERMCEDKQQLILSLERRLMGLSETLQKVRDGFLEKSADLEALQRKSDDEIAERDVEIASLKAELEKLKSPLQPKVKRGLLANIKEAVASPRKGGSGRILRKTVKTVQP